MKKTIGVLFCFAVVLLMVSSATAVPVKNAESAMDTLSEYEDLQRVIDDISEILGSDLTWSQKEEAIHEIFDLLDSDNDFRDRFLNFLFFSSILKMYTIYFYLLIAAPLVWILVCLFAIYGGLFYNGAQSPYVRWLDEEEEFWIVVYASIILWPLWIGVEIATIKSLFFGYDPFGLPMSQMDQES